MARNASKANAKSQHKSSKLTSKNAEAATPSSSANANTNASAGNGDSGAPQAQAQAPAKPKRTTNYKMLSLTWIGIGIFYLLSNKGCALCYGPETEEYKTCEQYAFYVVEFLILLRTSFVLIRK